MKTWIVCFLIAAGLWLGWTPNVRAAVTFTNTPSAVSNTYTGQITLQVSGLTAAGTVVVQKFLDLNTNGVIDKGDLLVQQFSLTDGQAGMAFGGVTNFNVPGDTDGAANGHITAKLNFQGGDFMQNVVGKYLFKVSGNFTPPITNSFTVTNFPWGQKFTGNVVSNGVAVPNAVVLLFVPDKSPIAGAIANNSGNYTIAAPAGTYSVVAFKSNFVANMSAAPVLALAASQTITNNPVLTNATTSISGRVEDASNSSIGLPGMLLPVQAKANGLIAVAFTDTNGNFNVPVTAGNWGIEGGDTALIAHGYLGLQNKTTVNAGVTGVIIAVPKATALIYGSVKDNLGNPLVALDVNANDQNNNLYKTDGYTDANGNYVLGVLGLGSSDPWWVSADNNNTLTNYILTQPDFGSNNGTNISASTAAQINFTGLLVTNYITGNVKANGTNIVGVGVNAYATINNANFSQHMDTDANGNYSLTVASGTWSVSVNCNGGSDSLDNILGSGNYQCPDNQNVNINDNHATNNFVVQTCGGVQILTTNLPGGKLNVFYDQFLQASSCNNNFTWSLNSGTVPPGLQLDSFGELFGTPSINGTFNFSIHVTDGNGSSTNQSLSLTIITPPPLLSTPVKTAGGQLQLSLNGNAENYYTIEYSTNLVNWVPLLITNPPNAQPLYLNFPVTNKAGFYQAYQSGIVVGQSDFSFGTGSVGTPVIYVNAADGVAVIPITRTNGLANDTCVNYSTSGGTAIGGCDYTPTSGTLCFAAGVTSSSISIPVSLGCSTTNQSATVNLQLSDTNGTVVLNAVLVIQRPKPVLAIYPTSLTVVVPDNCEQTITISNAGPQGSVLNYTVADDGVLGGFLNIHGPNSSGQESSTASGSLQAGQTAQVAFTVLDRFATNWIGGTLTTAPSIYTPGAANYVKYPISVEIDSAQTASQKLLNTWNGTWTGTSTPIRQFNFWWDNEVWPTNIPVPSITENGTWSLYFQQIDYENNIASGTFTWQGTLVNWNILTDTNYNAISASPIYLPVNLGGANFFL